MGVEAAANPSTGFIEAEGTGLSGKDLPLTLFQSPTHHPGDRELGRGASASGTHNVFPVGGIGIDLHPLNVQPVGAIVLRVQDVGTAQPHIVTFCQVQDLLAIPVDPHSGQQCWEG